MTKHNLEIKRSYTLLGKQPVKLIEYMIFKNDTNLDKCLILKFKNDCLETIHNITIEVTQLNDNGDNLHAANYIFDNLNVNKFERFITTKKIKLDKACTSIKYRLLNTESLNRKWENNLWTNKEKTKTPQQNIIQSKLKVLYHNYIPLPYFISFGLIMLYIVIVILVFYAMNS